MAQGTRLIDRIHWQYQSCRHRCCPQCGARAKDAWLQGRLAEVLPVPYAHLVFTLPHSLNGLYGAHPRWVIDTLVCLHGANSWPVRRQRPVDGQRPRHTCLQPGAAHLHTWTQDLATHVHLHAVMACGVLTKYGQWSAPARQSGFLFPVHALSRVFRGKFMAALAGARKAGKIERNPQGQAPAWRERHRHLYRHDWVWCTPKRLWAGRRKCWTT